MGSAPSKAIVREPSDPPEQPVQGSSGDQGRQQLKEGTHAHKETQPREGTELKEGTQLKENRQSSPQQSSQIRPIQESLNSDPIDISPSFENEKLKMNKTQEKPMVSKASTANQKDTSDTKMDQSLKKSPIIEQNLKPNTANDNSTSNDTDGIQTKTKAFNHAKSRLEQHLQVKLSNGVTKLQLGSNNDETSVVPVKKSKTSKEKCLEAVAVLDDAYERIEHDDYDVLLPILFNLAAAFERVGFGRNPTVARLDAQEVVGRLMELGTEQHMLNMAMCILPKTLKDFKELSDKEAATLEVLYGILINMTDRSENFTNAVCDTPDFLELNIESLVYQGLFSKAWDSTAGSFISNVHGTLYNCSMWYSNRRRLRDVGLVWILKRLTDEEDMDVKLTATLALAGILDEEESKFFKSETQSIGQLVMLMDRAAKRKDRRASGWSSSELATACSRLGANDVNKTLLVEAGVLKPLVKLCKTGDEIEQTEALGALWTLSFDKKNRQKMMESGDVVETVLSLKQSGIEGVRTQATNVLWTLHEELLGSPNEHFKQAGSELVHKISGSMDDLGDAPKHLMISYNWGSKLMVFRVHEALIQNGFKVWIDKTEMKGSIIDSIADGVENAEVLIMCVSPKYKASKYCRAEAEYAFTNDVDIVPLMMESDYKPDGWLGLIKGARKHFDLSQKESFERVIPTLIKDLGQKGKKSKGGKKPVAEPVIVPVHQPLVQSIPPAFAGDCMDSGHGSSGTHGSGVHSPMPGQPGNPAAWTPSAVKQFLEENQCYRPTFKDMNGSDLMFLSNLRKEAPEFFYNYLDTKLKVKEVRHMSKLIGALSKL